MGDASSDLGDLAEASYVAAANQGSVNVMMPYGSAMAAATAQWPLARPSISVPTASQPHARKTIHGVFVIRQLESCCARRRAERCGCGCGQVHMLIRTIGFPQPAMIWMTEATVAKAAATTAAITALGTGRCTIFIADGRSERARCDTRRGSQGF